MQKMAQSMGGGMGMPPGAAEQMKNMTADDFRRASEQMKNMTPDQMKSQMDAARNQQQAQAEYALKGAEKLKADGNKLVGEGKYKDAIEKYMRVKNNLADDPSPAAKTLRTSCMLNMALCFNKTNRHNSAVSECTEVLKADGKSLKAYYRRGQAYAAKGEHVLAVADLRRAVKLSPGDDTVKGELDRAVEALKAAGGEDDGETPAFEESEAAMGGSGAGMPGMPPGMDMKKAAEMMKDPEMMKKAAEMMENATEEQLEAMSKMGAGGAGMPKIDPKMAKQAAQMMKNMDPEAMSSMMEMATKMKEAGLDPAAAGAGGAPGPDMMSKMAETMKDPKMQEAMSSMMKNISPEQLKEMSAAAGMNMSDEQAAATAKMMQDISPETMQRMMKAGAFMNGIYSRFRGVFQWAARNKTTAMSLAVLFVAMLVSYFMRWGWFAPKSVVDAGTGKPSKTEEEEDSASAW